MTKALNRLKKCIDVYINNYEETPNGCGYNIGAEARKKAQAEKIKKALEEKAQRELNDYLTLRKAG